jgi:hypothetical protein
MAQQVWTFYDRSGTLHTFGIYHGEDSGHVMAYLDNAIMILDFKILDNKTYSFYYDEELLHFKIVKKGDFYEYKLENDLNAPTPLNEKNKLETRQERKIIMLLFAIILVVAYTIWSFFIR